MPSEIRQTFDDSLVRRQRLVARDKKVSADSTRRKARRLLIVQG